MEVCLVAYTCFNLNLDIFVETRPNRQQRLNVHSPLLKTPLRFNDESFVLNFFIKILLIVALV
jgi:hypothetical protein